jgi:predicted phage tail protein
MRTVKLYGHLGKKFGRSFDFDVASAAEAVRALCANFAGFREAMVGHKPGYHVHVGDEIVTEELLPFRSSSSTIKIVPVVSGAKNGIGQIIMGAVLIVAGYAVSVLSYGWAAPVGNAMIGMGASMILGGVTQLLTRAPKPAAPNNGGNDPNYSFNGPVNTTGQGNSVPVCYGRLIVGSQVISAALSVEQSTGRIAPPATGVLS